jgi:hypothetical protein
LQESMQELPTAGGGEGGGGGGPQRQVCCTRGMGKGVC